MRTSRREWLVSGMGALAGALVRGDDSRGATGGPLAIVDCHTHFYDPSRPGGRPSPGRSRIALPEHFLEQAAPLGVTRTVVVEASPHVEDNAWLLELADDHPAVVGVVGRLAPGEPGFAEHLERFAADKRFRGIRIGQEVLRHGLEQDEFLADVRRLLDFDLELDVNGGPDMPADVARLAEMTPGLTIVINHLANVPVTGTAPPQAWRDGMRAAAKHERVYCKVSALVEHARQTTSDGTTPDDVEFYRPVLDAAWEIFGDDRLIYASNWPVSERAAPYRTVFSIVHQYVTGRGRAAAEKFFWKNAQAAYRWPT